MNEGGRAGALRVSPPHKSPAGPALHLARCTAFLQERGFGGRERREGAKEGDTSPGMRQIGMLEAQGRGGDGRAMSSIGGVAGSSRSATAV